MRKIQNQKLMSEFIDPAVQGSVYTQEYNNDQHIADVRIVEIKNIVGEDGYFSEILRLDSQGGLELFPEFKLAQINRTTQMAQTVKAWHVHFLQDEIWYVAPTYHLFVGLWDVRRDSPTKGVTNRITLGGGNSQLLFIPRGIAHGSAVFGYEPVNLYYFINQTFNAEKPDEQRIAWDHLGKDFWEPQKD